MLGEKQSVEQYVSMQPLVRKKREKEYMCVHTQKHTCMYIYIYTYIYVQNSSGRIIFN